MALRVYLPALDDALGGHPWGYMVRVGCVLGTGEAFESLRREHLVWVFPLLTHIGRWSRNPRLTWIKQNVGLDGLLGVAVERTSGHMQSESSPEGKILGIRSFVLILRSFSSIQKTSL